MNTPTIGKLVNPRIEWVVHDSQKYSERKAVGKWQDWEFTVEHNERGGWNVKVNGIQAWTHMRKFEDAMHSVAERLRDWAYFNQFKT